MQSITGRQLEVFRLAINTLNAANVQYVIGGAFAVHYYGGPFRNTKDLDVYMDISAVPAAVFALTQNGFEDAGETVAGDLDWIYHSRMDQIMVDVIWKAPNGIRTVPDGQYERAPRGTFLDLPVRFMPPDDLVVTKLFTMNLHRCDWPDLLRVLRADPPGFDWNHLLGALGEYWPVLLSFIVLFDWVHPNEARCIPPEVRNDLLARKAANPEPEPGPTHEQILDPWIYTRPPAT